jgi:hypothetical protein
LKKLALKAETEAKWNISAGFEKQKADCATNLFKEVKEKWQKLENSSSTLEGL